MKLTQAITRLADAIDRYVELRRTEQIEERAHATKFQGVMERNVEILTARFEMEKKHIDKCEERYQKRLREQVAKESIN